MNIKEFVKKQMKLEADSIMRASELIDDNVEKAIELIISCSGKVVAIGMGKSGIIAKKISATLASTGTTSIFLHPAEGIHGDLGMLQKNDVVIAISQSGNTQEVVAVIPYIKFLKIPLIAITGNQNSILAQNADVVLNSSIPEGYEPFNMVPTCSAVVQLSLGDALAVALLEKKEFKINDYALFHPGGTIGKKLLLKVSDLMHSGEENPTIYQDECMKEAIVLMTSKGLGCANVIDKDKKLMGIITDGDLRRFLAKGNISLDISVNDIMTKNPKRMKTEQLAVEALNLMEKYKITMLPIVDDDDCSVGLLHMHDLIRSGVVT
ncbi:MAG TPA: KpsF/GutQ family sugar-phosphate isomerase [Candidatus Cloacimonadota bacterium]|jgi:arabinose-5-phosphate isomerase|nr:KpsF/GutQ family sugar-phosphate isomerase [Candidatus Cloacimonadales bacterium]HOE91153.1 KpsF/GutQ family sugar-phosphate isomerase [Candidatus Cloacimonadota bacterium]HOQ79634.1 KpsF/GutQ family sugar-phosphate isomerase [Candidatus Cloacimonadota bacterium]HPK40725.1 KpsF/GutQ family sugar-phosphate isomerase [Candidatus Cloacimonadota bacterium]HPY97277.1 KpsF/GutQ family sugar-phosphate isomerase [Candidatus Cloacimonadota bacterium]